MKARLCVVGAGRSGAVTAACLADLGHTVCAIDVDEARVAELRRGKAPFFEEGLDEIIARNVENGRLTFDTGPAASVPEADAVLLCVPTPASATGEADLSMLRSALRDVAPLLHKDALVITRSTVPVGTNASLAEQLREERPDLSVRVVSNPEFLREGHAVEDFMRPERIVIGGSSEKAAQDAAQLYDGIDCPMLLTDLETAELAKYAANAYLAASISFINEIANICEYTGADVAQVAEALSLDRRIGPHAYLAPGIGFGGSCLPKDLSALISTAESHDYSPPMLRAIAEVNDLQPKRVVGHLEEIFGDLSGLSMAVLGISFKGDTFDLRSSPAMSVIRHLKEAGVRVHAFDPLADDTITECLGPVAELHLDAYRAAEGCHAIVVATDHSQFRQLDLERLGQAMASRVFIDGRNQFDPTQVTSAGFSYIGIGRARRGD